MTSTSLVINEMAPSGPFGRTDEFVELRNLGSQPVDVSGWTIRTCSKPGPSMPRVMFPPGTSLAPVGEPGQYLLVAHFGFHPRGTSGSQNPDIVYSTDLPNNGGWLIIDAEGTLVDGVGLGAGLPCTEDGPAPSCNWTSRQATSRDLGGSDADDNSTDLECRPATPTDRIGL